MFQSFKLPFFRKTVEPEPVVQVPREVPGPIGKAPPVREAYPQVRALAVNLLIQPPDKETEPTLNGRSFGPDSLSYFEFRCKNTICHEGGFDLSDTFAEAIAARKQEVTGRQVCNGWHGKERINQLRCRYELNFKASITYSDLPPLADHEQ